MKMKIIMITVFQKSESTATKQMTIDILQRHLAGIGVHSGVQGESIAVELETE